MSVYFIADLHLAPETPKLLDLFRGFCATLKENDELYIIGDLFGYYVGLDFNNIAQISVKEQVLELKNRKVEVNFIHGNRDFLLSQKDADYFGFKLLKDIHLLHIHEHIITILHGDELCKGNTAYCIFRFFSRLKLFQILFKNLTPKHKRISIAEQMRKKSHLHFIAKNCSKEMINYPEAHKLLKKLGSDILIHGHTHNAECLNQHGYKLCDTGDWNESNFSYIVINENCDIKLIISPSK